MLEAFEMQPYAFVSSVEERRALPMSWWQERLSGSEGREVVVGGFVDGRLVGAAGVWFDEREKVRHKATVVGMYVTANCRRLGLGRDLLEAVIAAARANVSIRVVQLAVTEGNTAATRLYESFGFKVFGMEPYAVRVGAEYVGQIHMWLNLRAAEAENAA